MRQLLLFYYCNKCGPIPYQDCYVNVERTKLKHQCKACLKARGVPYRRRTGLYLGVRLKKMGYSWKEVDRFFKKHRSLEERERAFFNLDMQRGGDTNNEVMDEQERITRNRYNPSSWGRTRSPESELEEGDLVGEVD